MKLEIVKNYCIVARIRLDTSCTDCTKLAIHRSEQFPVFGSLSIIVSAILISQIQVTVFHK